MNELTPAYRLTGYELDLDILAALATLTEAQRDAWIDRYVAGLPYPTNSARTSAYNAAKQLRHLLADRVAA